MSCIGWYRHVKLEPARNPFTTISPIPTPSRYTNTVTGSQRQGFLSRGPEAYSSLRSQVNMRIPIRLKSAIAACSLFPQNLATVLRKWANVSLKLRERIPLRTLQKEGGLASIYYSCRNEKDPSAPALNLLKPQPYHSFEFRCFCSKKCDLKQAIASS